MYQVYVAYFMDLPDTPIFDGVSNTLEGAKRLSQKKYDEGIEEDGVPASEADILKWIDLPNGEGADCEHDNGQRLVLMGIRRVEFFEG